MELVKALEKNIVVRGNRVETANGTSRRSMKLHKRVKQRMVREEVGVGIKVRTCRVWQLLVRRSFKK